ncbi:MAG: hypothetical protein KA045_01615 [Burkholderiaceae bacterium]|nr:hypothetical protein [Burkholderiaceae bacterium]
MLNVDQHRPTLSGIFMGKTMQALTPLSPQTMAELGIPADSEVHSVRDADKLGIELIGPEHDEVDALDFVEVHHD